MGWLDRLGRLIRANLNSLVSQAEDPEKILEQTVLDMQDDLNKLRQAAALAIATQKRAERQCNQAENNADEWYRRAELALQKGDEELAREALNRRKSFVDTAQVLQSQINQQSGVIGKLKSNMRTLESKLTEARTKKDMYIARAQSAQASRRLNEMLGQVGSYDSQTAFERMEQKVLQMEAQADAVAELNASSNELENRFRSLESHSVDDELEAMKVHLAITAGPMPNPSTQLPNLKSLEAPLDPDLERLRSQLEEA